MAAGICEQRVNSTNRQLAAEGLMVSQNRVTPICATRYENPEGPIILESPHVHTCKLFYGPFGGGS